MNLGNAPKWHTTTVDWGLPSRLRSLAEVNGQPAISYSDGYNQRVRYLRYNGSSWIGTNIDTLYGYGRLGWSNSLTVVNGESLIVYNDDFGLRYTRQNGWAWSEASFVVRSGDEPSLAVVNGQPAFRYYVATGTGAFYSARPDKDLRYAWYDGLRWQSVPVDKAGAVGRFSSLAVINGAPAISYYDEIHGTVKFAWFGTGYYQPAPTWTPTPASPPCSSRAKHPRTGTTAV